MSESADGPQGPRLYEYLSRLPSHQGVTVDEMAEVLDTPDADFDSLEVWVAEVEAGEVFCTQAPLVPLVR